MSRVQSRQFGWDYASNSVYLDRPPYPERHCLRGSYRELPIVVRPGRSATRELPRYVTGGLRGERAGSAVRHPEVYRRSASDGVREESFCVLSETGKRDRACRLPCDWRRSWTFSVVV